MIKTLKQNDLDAVEGLSSRAAAALLHVGKSTVNNARKAAVANGGKLPETDGDTTDALVTGSAVPQTAEEVEKLLGTMGIDRERYEVALDFSVYGRDDPQRSLKVRTKLRKVEEAPVEYDFDPAGILATLREQTRSIEVPPNHKPWETANYWDEAAFVLSINDIQLGQSYNGGSEATITQFYEFIRLAKLRIAELRLLGRNLTHLVIIGGGDLVEGCVIYGNQSFSLDLNRKQQVEGIITLLLFAIDELAPLFQNVSVLASRGNHGEHRISGKYTTLDDNDDTHVFEMCKLVLDRDPAMGHINWTIAQSEAGVATCVFGWVLATTHGDIYAKGVTGATIDKKAHNWLKNMALGGKKFGLLGQADVLITHHFHHDKMSDWGACLWRQTPSQDRGSPYFELATGEFSEPGMLTFVMTESNRYQDEAVLR